MSMFLNCSAPAMGSNGLLHDNDTRNQPADWAKNPEDTIVFGAMAPFQDAVLWPVSRFAAGDRSAPLAPFGGDFGETGRYAPPRNLESGATSFGRITGNTKDSSGNPLGSCSINAFITSTNAVEPYTVTSDAGGYYDVPCASIGVAHYIVAYKPASPDVAGTTVDTIIPTY